MDFLKEKWFLDFIIPIISIIVTYFVKKYILSVFDKQDINNILSNVRNAYKDQLEIFKISKESDYKLKEIFICKRASKY